MPIKIEVFNRIHCHLIKKKNEQIVWVGICNRKLKEKSNGHTDMMQISAVVFVPWETYKILTSKTRSYFSREP